jgi:uncharacterized RDD family membrane protein YckC
MMASLTGDQLFILLGLACFVALAGCVACAGVIVAIVGLYKAPHESAQVFANLTKRSGLLHILVAGAIVLVALILRLLDRIPSDAVVAILSSIAGYVLGGILPPGRSGKQKDDE